MPMFATAEEAIVHIIDLTERRLIDERDARKLLKKHGIRGRELDKIIRDARRL